MFYGFLMASFAVVVLICVYLIGRCVFTWHAGSWSSWTGGSNCWCVGWVHICLLFGYNSFDFQLLSCWLRHFILQIAWIQITWHNVSHNANAFSCSITHRWTYLVTFTRLLINLRKSRSCATQIHPMLLRSAISSGRRCLSHACRIRSTFRMAAGNVYLQSSTRSSLI